jgi:hypothetical protein
MADTPHCDCTCKKGTFEAWIDTMPGPGHEDTLHVIGTAQSPTGERCYLLPFVTAATKAESGHGHRGVFELNLLCRPPVDRPIPNADQHVSIVLRGVSPRNYNTVRIVQCELDVPITIVS